MNSNISLNIAILPDEQTRNRAIELSQKVNEKVNSYFVLDPENFLPHITVYQAHFPVKNLRKIKERVSLVTAKIKPFIINLNRFSVSHDTFLFWDCLKTNHLVNLQKDMIEHLNPLRNGLVLPLLKKITGISPKDKKDIKNYGSLLIGQRYQPHITITRIKDNKDAKDAFKILDNEKKNASFEVKSIIIGYLGDHGTVNGVIQSYPL